MYHLSIQIYKHEDLIAFRKGCNRLRIAGCMPRFFNHIKAEKVHESTNSTMASDTIQYNSSGVANTVFYFVFHAATHTWQHGIQLAQVVYWLQSVHYKHLHNKNFHRIEFLFCKLIIFAPFLLVLCIFHDY